MADGLEAGLGRQDIAQDLARAAASTLGGRGKPYWEVLYNNNPPVWEMIADLAERFGFDAMIQVALDKSAAEEEMESARIIEATRDHLLV